MDGDADLVGQQVDSGSGETENRSLADAGAAEEGFGAQIECFRRITFAAAEAVGAVSGGEGIRQKVFRCRASGMEMVGADTC
jgi:hypothetical protein